MGKNKRKSTSQAQSLAEFDGVWTKDLESVLLDAVEYFKPLGPVKFIAMRFIRLHIEEKAGVRVPAKAIYDRLASFWNLDALDPDFNLSADEVEAEISDFELPEEFAEDMRKAEEGLDFVDADEESKSKPKPKSKSAKTRTKPKPTAKAAGTGTKKAKTTPPRKRKR